MIQLILFHPNNDLMNLFFCIHRKTVLAKKKLPQIALSSNPSVSLESLRYVTIVCL